MAGAEWDEEDGEAMGGQRVEHFVDEYKHSGFHLE